MTAAIAANISSEQETTCTRNVEVSLCEDMNSSRHSSLLRTENADFCVPKNIQRIFGVAFYLRAAVSAGNFLALLPRKTPSFKTRLSTRPLQFCFQPCKLSGTDHSSFGCKASEIISVVFISGVRVNFVTGFMESHHFLGTG